MTVHGSPSSSTTPRLPGITDADGVPAIVLMRLVASELERGGVVVLGAIIVLGLGADGLRNKLLQVIAIAFGTINVVGGFLVTDRMLEMFKSKPAPPREGPEQ